MFKVELTEAKQCDIGSCHHKADSIIIIDRVGIESKIVVCKRCTRRLIEVLKGVDR